MDVEIFSICDFAQVSENKLTAVGIFDLIWSDKFPVKRNFSIALRLRFEEEEAGKHKFKIEIVEPNSSNILTDLSGEINISDQDGHVKPGYNNAQLSLNFNKFVFKKEGQHWIRLFIDGDKVASRPLNLVKANKQ